MLKNAAQAWKTITWIFRECLRLIPCKPVYFLCLMVLLVPLYFGLNTRFTFNTVERPYPIHFDMLGNAMLKGQLHLETEVAPERIGAPFPADPSLPYPYIMDALIFQGKYYLRQEPFPGLVHAAWILVTGSPLHTGLAVVTTSMGVLLFLALTIGAVRNYWFPSSPPWLYWFTVAAFALSGMQLQIVSRPLIYHEVITWGMMFVVLGTLFFTLALKHEQHALVLFTLSGTAMGTAILCKITLAAYPICFLLFLLRARPQKSGSPSELTKRVVSFTMPLLFCAFVLLGYNYARFGNPLDLGSSYFALPLSAAWEYCCRDGNFTRLAHIPYNVYNYLATLPQITWVYHGQVPFLFWDYEVIDTKGVFIQRQQLGSIFLFAPVLLLLLRAQTIRYLRASPPGFSALIGGCLTASLLVFLVYTTYAIATSRFAYEFTPLLFILIFCNLAALWTEVLRKAVWVTPKRMILVALLGINTLMGLTLGLNGSFTGKSYNAVSTEPLSSLSITPPERYPFDLKAVVGRLEVMSDEPH